MYPLSFCFPPSLQYLGFPLIYTEKKNKALSEWTVSQCYNYEVSLRVLKPNYISHCQLSWFCQWVLFPTAIRIKVDYAEFLCYHAVGYSQCLHYWLRTACSSVVVFFLLTWFPQNVSENLWVMKLLTYIEGTWPKWIIWT